MHLLHLVHGLAVALTLEVLGRLHRLSVHLLHLVHGLAVALTLQVLGHVHLDRLTGWMVGRAGWRGWLDGWADWKLCIIWCDTSQRAQRSTHRPARPRRATFPCCPPPHQPSPQWGDGGRVREEGGQAGTAPNNLPRLPCPALPAPTRPPACGQNKPLCTGSRLPTGPSPTPKHPNPAHPRTLAVA